MENQVVQSVCVWCWMGGWTRRKLSFFPIILGRSFVSVCVPLLLSRCAFSLAQVASEGWPSSFAHRTRTPLGKGVGAFVSFVFQFQFARHRAFPVPRVQLQQQATLPAYGFNLQSRMEGIPFAQVFFVCGCEVEKIFLRIGIFRFWNSIFCVLAPGAAGSSEIGNRC